MTTPDSPSEADWESILLAAEEEPLRAKLDFPYYIRVSLIYTGSSKAKGGEWLEMVNRKVVKLKERKFRLFIVFQRLDLSIHASTRSQFLSLFQRLDLNRSYNLKGSISDY